MGAGHQAWLTGVLSFSAVTVQRESQSPTVRRGKELGVGGMGIRGMAGGRVKKQGTRMF